MLPDQSDELIDEQRCETANRRFKQILSGEFAAAKPAARDDDWDHQNDVLGEKSSDGQLLAGRVLWRIEPEKHRVVESFHGVCVA